MTDFVLFELDPASEVFAEEAVAPGLLGATDLFELGSAMPPFEPGVPWGTGSSLGIAFVLPGDDGVAMAPVSEVPFVDVAAGAFVEVFAGA